MAAAMVASANDVMPKSKRWLTPQTRPVQNRDGTTATMAIPVKTSVETMEERSRGKAADAVAAVRVLAKWSGIIVIQPFPIVEPLNERPF